MKLPPIRYTAENKNSFIKQDAAAVITSCIRTDDTAGHRGGEEFMVIIPAVDREAAVEISERISNPQQSIFRQ